MGYQCGGKDFCTVSVRKNSALNRGQRLSKTKTAALRCIVWSFLCGLVFAMTPLVLSCISKNLLVHWFASVEEGESKYVPMSRPDWDDKDLDEYELSDDEEVENSLSFDADDYQYAIQVGMIDGMVDYLFDSNLNGEEQQEEDDKCME